MAEYTDNDNDSERNSIYLFISNNGYNSQFRLNSGQATDLRDTGERGLATLIQDLLDTLKEEMVQAQEVYRETAD